MRVTRLGIMIIDNRVDVCENYIMQLDPRILQTLLADHSSGRNMIWATNNYIERGEGYGFHDELTPEKITGANGQLIRPRVKKSMQEQTYRSREKGEVFTPAWICNAQNNLIDNAWYGGSDIFNHEMEKDWLTLSRRIPFPSPTGRSWKDYVKDTRLEITCGEAPYLASRYDTTTGGVIPVENRIGILDRKLRVVAENTRRKKDWFIWARQALCSTYGYEWQGDSLLLAREGLLFTYIDHFKKRWGGSTEPPIEELLRIAEIISWNLWQMDGLKGVIPNSCHEETTCSRSPSGECQILTTSCPGCCKNDIRKHNGVLCVIRDWEARGRVLPYISLLSSSRA